MYKPFVILPVCLMLLTACSSAPKSPEVVKETPLDLHISSESLTAPDLDARIVYMSDGSTHLTVSNPWQARHRFSHPMLASAWEACRKDGEPQGLWQLREAEIRNAGNIRISTLPAHDWQALEAMDLPSEADYDNARLHATLHFNDDSASVDGKTAGSVRAGSGHTRLADRLTARITGISQSPDQTRMDGEIVITRRLQVEVVNRSNRTWRVNLERSGGELDGDILTGARGGASPVIYPGTTTNVEIPLLLPVQAEDMLGVPRRLDRVEMAEMNGFQWQPDSHPKAQRVRSGYLQYDAAAYLMLGSDSGQSANGFVDGVVVVDLLDTIDSVNCQ